LIGAVIPPVDREASRCSPLARLLGAHADGQLDAAKTLEVDDHLAQCETCRERVALDRAIRGSLKKAVNATSPDDVRARMVAAMAAQSARDAKERAEVASVTAAAIAELGSDADGVRSGRPAMLRHWRTALPLASAAAIALAWGFASKQPMSVADNTARLGAGFSNDELVNQFVDVHRHPIHPETPDPKEVRAFEREVGVPVHVPQLEKNARFVGGRLLPVQGGERAAMLQYEVAQANGGIQRVSVFIYDPRRVQIRSAEQLPPRSVGTAQVRVGQAHGYSLAVAQHGSVGYAVASDLEDSSAQYAVAVDRE
jgi:anti-sigma factor RsiW